MNEQNKIIWREFGDDARKSAFPATIKFDDTETLYVTWDDYLTAREESIEERYQAFLKTTTGSESDESRKNYKFTKGQLSIARSVNLGQFVMTVFADENRFYEDNHYIREKGTSMKIDTRRNKYFLNDDNKNNKNSVGNPIEYLQMLGFDFVTSVSILLQYEQGLDVKSYFKKENDDAVLSDDNAFQFYMTWQTT